MILKKLILFLIAFLIFHAKSYSQSYSDQRWEILKLMDSRSPGKDNNLTDYLHSIDPELRQTVIYALANIADSTTVSLIDFLISGPFKDYPLESDLKACAFMLGQINCGQSRNMLKAILQNKNDFKFEMNKAGSYFIDAIGKTGDEIMMNELLEREDILNSTDISIRRALPLAIAKFALRKIKNEKSVEVLKQIANTSEDTICMENTAFAFWRTGDKSLLESAKNEIFNLAGSKDPQTRMWAFNALGKLQDKSLLNFTLESFDSEPDWRVKVNMLNSLNNYVLDSIPDMTLFLLSALGDAMISENEHVSLTAAAVLGNIFHDIRESINPFASSMASGLKDELTAALNSNDTLSWRQKTELAKSLSKMYRDEIKDELLRIYSETDNYDLKKGILEAIGYFRNPKIFREIRDTVRNDVKRYVNLHPDSLGQFISSEDLAKVYRGFVQMLTDLDDNADKEDLNIFRLVYTEFASSKDPVAVDICLSALRDSIYKKYREESASVLIMDYGELNFPEDADVMLIYIDAMKDLYNDSAIKILEGNLNFGNYEIAKASMETLEKITWKKYGMQFNARRDHDKNYFDNIETKKIVRLNTSKGVIEIELLPEAAPFTVMNFLKLIERGFYDGTVFHRVVPNFVIQGGDPRGTGYGGPGYSVRSEFSPLEFKEGMVGMASSGKDTEGSQFFITHSATPHLDGKYTLFGKVIEGMETVDKIMAGDRIVNIEIINQ